MKKWTFFAWWDWHIPCVLYHKKNRWFAICLPFVALCWYAPGAGEKGE